MFKLFPVEFQFIKASYKKAPVLTTNKPLADENSACLDFTLVFCEFHGKSFSHGSSLQKGSKCTLPETNMAPKNGWLEY